MDVVIQVSKGAYDKKFVYLNTLVQALSNRCVGGEGGGGFQANPLLEGP